MRKSFSTIICFSLEFAIVVAFVILMRTNDNEMEIKYNNKNIDTLKYVNQTSALFSLDGTNDKIAEPSVLSGDDSHDVEVPLKKVDIDSYAVIDSYLGTLTGYGPDCRGCSGRTATSYDVSNTITYVDSNYGELRILAADRSIPFYSVVRVSNVDHMDPFLAIVLDRGGTVGFGQEKVTTFDLLFSSESDAKKNMPLMPNVVFEVIRVGK